eukprot:COSAG06_NODE_7767_length_2382_cov_1.723609_4_plen_306_part_00
MLAAPSLCVPCNDLLCIDCSAEIPTVREGWAEAGTVSEPSTSPWLLFECPIADACMNTQQQRCRTGHAGPLCKQCQPSYGLKDNMCQPCTAVNSSPVLPLVVTAIIILIAGVAYAKHHQRSEASSSASLLEAQLTTDNPLQRNALAYDSTDKRQSLSRTTVQRTDDAYMLLRVLYQPVRILVGYVQVVSQIGIVLDINLPPTIQAVFEFLKPFSGLLTEFFHLDCLGNFDFYTKWIFRVFVMPALLFSLALLRYSYVRYRGDETAMKNAVGGLKSDGFVVLFLVYRACMTLLSQSNALNANAHTF